MHLRSGQYLYLLVFLLVSINSPSLNNQSTQWGFYGHQLINRLAIFTLPPEMIVFYKKHLPYLAEHAVDPDKRRYAIKEEAPRHFIDLDYYGDSATYRLAKPWPEIVLVYPEDTLLQHGIVPWHIQLMKFQLTSAFTEKNLGRILKISAEIGHYIADANVPLHTTSNYNGQKTNQIGIHGFWESRLPELFAHQYDFFVGKARYIPHTQSRIWQNIRTANQCLDSVFIFEKALHQQTPLGQKYSIDERNNINVKSYSVGYATQYHTLLNNQVERQMRNAVKMVGDFWFTCWVDAGQPDLNTLGSQPLLDSIKKGEDIEQKNWLLRIFQARDEN